MLRGGWYFFLIVNRVEPDRTPGRNNRISQGDQWMFESPSKNPLANVPHGLSFLNSISALFIQQEVNLGQTITGLSSAQRFQVFNQEGQLVFYAAENNAQILHRICCAARRGFVLHISDQSSQEVIRISREFKCCGGCCFWCAGADCCAHELRIESLPGVVLGTIRQLRSFWRSYLSLRDSTGREYLRVLGPCCICQGVFCCCCENKFKLINVDNDAEIGGIFEEYAGLINQAFTGAGKYAITFPIDMPVQLKGIALGALFLINFMHFGRNAKSKGGTSIFSLVRQLP